MKKYIKSFIITFFAIGLGMTSCGKWTDLNVKDSEDLLHSNNTDQYYEQLRAYKKSDHPVAFGWFGNWVGKGSSLSNSMAGLPDSVDFVSMWGGWKAPNQDMLNDLQFVQQVKGTKALVCCIILDIGDQITPEKFNATLEDRKEFWGWDDNDEDKIHEAIRKYAQAFCDTIHKYDYDGFDLDWEPSYEHSFETKKEMAILNRIDVFIEEMGKHIGPKLGTDKLFVIDGEPENISSELGVYFDYFISQAYGRKGYQGKLLTTKAESLQTRLNKVIDNFTGILTAEECANKFIVCENFEDFALMGGVPFEDENGVIHESSLEGFAMWNPKVNNQLVRKGGVGTFHMEYEYFVPNNNGNGTKTYPYLRNAIQYMNPSVH